MSCRPASKELVSKFSCPSPFRCRSDRLRPGGRRILSAPCAAFPDRCCIPAAGFQQAFASLRKNSDHAPAILRRMQLAELGTRRPVCIDSDASILAASRLMREQDVSDLVVTERQDSESFPIGILSAREIVTRVLALQLDPGVLKVGDGLWGRPLAVG